MRLSPADVGAARAGHRQPSNVVHGPRAADVITGSHRTAHNPAELPAQGGVGSSVVKTRDRSYRPVEVLCGERLRLLSRAECQPRLLNDRVGLQGTDASSGPDVMSVLPSPAAEVTGLVSPRRSRLDCQRAHCRQRI